jgi:hypothetical protein
MDGWGKEEVEIVARVEVVGGYARMVTGTLVPSGSFDVWKMPRRGLGCSDRRQGVWEGNDLP